jgi:hypothetical protein
VLTTLFAALLILYTLSILFDVEVHKHPTHTEYGIRVCGGYKTDNSLVIGLGKLILRIR